MDIYRGRVTALLASCWPSGWEGMACSATKRVTAVPSTLDLIFARISAHDDPLWKHHMWTAHQCLTFCDVLAVRPEYPSQ